MGQVQLQQNLFTDAGDYVAGLHQDSKNFRVYICQNQGLWKQKSLSFDKAVIYANELQNDEAKDCYVSANAFSWQDQGRTLSSVSSINGFYVDFDRYKTDLYKNLHPAEFLGIILDENPWLPPPTFFMDSGNGCWAFWQFKRSITTKSKKVDWLPQWQWQQDFLTHKLKKYGADPSCSDASRVVRLANTVNSKTNRKASAWETAQRYDFAEIKKSLVAESNKERSSYSLVPETTTRAKSKHKAAKVSHLRNWHSLAHARMQDLIKLAHLRGGRYTDHRRRVGFTYAVEAAHFCRTEESLRAEVEQFIQDCIQEPEKYLKVPYTAVIKRFNDENALIASGMSRREAHETLDAKDKGRYKHKRTTIVEKLDITTEEGRELQSLFSNEEKQRRQTIAKREKSRQQGAMPRSEYENRAKQRKQEAQKLYKKLESIRAVAAEMKLSVGVVHRYIHD